MQPQSSPPKQQRITGAVLAGGEGRRMGGADKGLVDYRDRPLAASVLERLAPQVAEVLIVANRNRVRYEALGVPVHSDLSAGFQGPLAGMLSALRHARTEFVLCVPCDSPKLPADLAERLLHELLEHDADACAAHDGERLHPVFCLLRRSLADNLSSALKADLRQVKTWLAQQRFTVADFSDRADCFRNCNTPAELAALAALEPGRRSRPTAPGTR